MVSINPGPGDELGIQVVDGLHQLGLYTCLFLKRAKRVDLPVVQSNKFDLVRTQTAPTLGLTVPASPLALADELIE